MRKACSLEGKMPDAVFVVSGVCLFVKEQRLRKLSAGEERVINQDKKPKIKKIKKIQKKC